ncbi:MAG: hypothetical protein ACHQNE_03355 [Candidatus Kapaibacterium sp.]
MKLKSFFAIAALLCLSSCGFRYIPGPKSAFERLTTTPTPKTDTVVAVAQNPPGRNYQLLGVVMAAGVDAKHSAIEDVLLKRARFEGADAINIFEDSSSVANVDMQHSINANRADGSYHASYNVTKLSAYAVRWAQPSDSNVMMGNVSFKDARAKLPPGEMKQ